MKRAAARRLIALLGWLADRIDDVTARLLSRRTGGPR